MISNGEVSDYILIHIHRYSDVVDMTRPHQIDYLFLGRSSHSY